MSNPKKSFIRQIEIEDKIEALEKIWTDYINFVQFINSGETSMTIANDLGDKLYKSVDGYLAQILHPTCNQNKVKYTPREHFQRRYFLPWKDPTDDGFAIANFLNQVLFHLFEGRRPMTVFHLKERFDQCEYQFEMLPKVYDRLMKLLKPLVPYLYDEEGNKYPS